MSRDKFGEPISAYDLSRPRRKREPSLDPKPHSCPHCKSLSEELERMREDNEQLRQVRKCHRDNGQGDSAHGAAALCVACENRIRSRECDSCADMRTANQGLMDRQRRDASDLRKANARIAELEGLLAECKPFVQDYARMFEAARSSKDTTP